MKQMSWLPQAQPQSPDATADFVREISLKNEVARAQSGPKCLKITYCSNEQKWVFLAALCSAESEVRVGDGVQTSQLSGQKHMGWH